MIESIKRIEKNVQLHEKQILIFLFILTLFLRTIHVVITYNSAGTSSWSDDWEYLSMGKQISEGNWSPMLDESRYMRVGPVLPVLIALFIKAFGNPPVPIFIYNILLTSLLVPLLCHLGKEVFNNKVGWLSALWGVFYVDFFKYNPHLLKEPTVFFFLPLTIFLLIRSLRKDKLLLYLLLSAFSFSFLIHSDERYFVYFPILPLIYMIKGSVKLQQRLKYLVSWIGLVLILMLPWGIHNYKVFGQIVIISTRTTAFTSKIWGEDLARMPFTGEHTIAQDKYKRALEFGKEYEINPREYGRTEACLKAFINFWQPTYFRPTYIQYGYRPQKWSLVHNFAGLLFYGIFLPFYILGIIFLIKKKYIIGVFIASIPIIHSLIHAFMIWPLERYRSPVTFIIVMIGIYSFIELFECLKKAQEHKRGYYR